MTVPAVSVVVPIRNEAGTLQEFLDALAAQTVSPIETVLVDAGSSDATREMLTQYATCHAGVRVIDAGAAYPGRARNVGIRAATAEWVALTDAGTIADPHWLDELTRTAAPDVDAVFGTYDPLLRTRFQRYVALSFLAPGEPAAGRRFRGPSTASMLLKKAVWEEVGGFPEDLRACEDLVFFKRIAAGAYRTVRAPRATVAWRLPSTPAQVFRRFRTYSDHTLRAGLGAHWHLAIARMYLVGGACVVVGIVSRWPGWYVLPLVGLAARALRSMASRPDVTRGLGVGIVWAALAVPAMLVWIDFAAAVGAVDFAGSRRSRGYPARTAGR